MYFILNLNNQVADGQSETLKVQQTAISIIFSIAHGINLGVILHSSPLANSDTELIIGQLLNWEPILN